MNVIVKIKNSIKKEKDKALSIKDISYLQLFLVVLMSRCAILNAEANQIEK